METKLIEYSQNIRAKVNGATFPINKQESELLMYGEWYPIYEDQDGDFYIFIHSNAYYLEVEHLT